jgi:hypothetical protein
MYYVMYLRSHDNSVGIALSYGLQDWASRVRFPGRGNFFFSPPYPERAQLPTQWVPGAISLGVKLLGHETDHSTPSSAEVK